MNSPTTGTLEIGPGFLKLMLPELEQKQAITSDEFFMIRFLEIVEGTKSAVNMLIQVLRNQPV